MDKKDENQSLEEERKNEGIKEILQRAKKNIPVFLKKILTAIMSVLLVAGAMSVFLHGIISLVAFPVKAEEYLLTPDQQKFINTKYADLIEAISEYEDIITIGDDGQYIINDKTSELVINILESNAVDTEVMGLSTDKFGNMIQKYIEAEMKTLYPKTNAPGNEMDGSIIIKRKLASTGEVITLTYEPWKTFQDRIDNATDDVAVTFFSINPEDLKLYIAERGNSTIYKDYNGHKIEGKGTSTGKTIQGYDYQTLVQNYSVPFNFWMILHVMADDVNFMNRVVNEILNNENPIEITFVESSTQQTTTINYEGYDNTIYEKVILSKLEDDEQHLIPEPGSIPENKFKDIDNSNALDYNSSSVTIYDYYQEVITTNTVQIYVTKADSLFKKTERQIEKIDVSGDGNQNEDTTDKIEPKSYEVGRTQISPNEILIEKRNLYLKEHITSTNIGNIYTAVDVGESQIEQKVKDFANMLKQEYPKVAQNLISAPSMIFSSLQEYENTQQHEKIMRFVIAMLDGNNHGVTLEDLEYLLSDSDYVSSIDLLQRYIKHWNFSTVPQKDEKGENYIINADDEGNLIVGNGINVNKYESEFIKLGYSTEIGGKIPVEYVDSLEEKELKTLKESIETYVSDLGLTTYQITALVSRYYGFDDQEIAEDITNFITLYQDVDTPDIGNKYEEKDKIPDLEHPIYIQYMSKLVNDTDSSSYSKKLSEWTLFQTGYYNVLGQWTTGSDKILEIAEEIHRYMEVYKYTYCVKFCNDEEECSNRSQCGLNTTFEASKTGYHKTCCATYVSWVLQETGYISNSEHTDSASGIKDLLSKKGWTEINSVSKLEPGDIIYFKGHVEIYAGDGQRYNAGSGNAIRKPAPATRQDWSSFICGFRAPK